jgi:hypothetical protein
VWQVSVTLQCTGQAGGRRPNYLRKSGKMEKKTMNTGDIGVAAAVSRGIISLTDKERFWEITGRHGACWVSHSEFRTNEKGALAKITRATGAALILASSINRLKEEMERFDDYVEGHVARQTGWVGDAFAFGNGEVSLPAESAVPCIVAFEADPRFSPSGSLEDWCRQVWPLLRNQPMLTFLAGVSMAPALFRWVGADFLNPVVELHGEPMSGKSSALAFAASIWAGNSASTTGAAMSGDMTVNAIDQQRSTFSGMCLPIDEAWNVTDPKALSELVVRFVHGTSGSDSRKRHGDLKPPDAIRGSTVVTANLSLEEALHGLTPSRRQGVLSRVVSLQVSREAAAGSCTIFVARPTEALDNKEAAAELMDAARVNYGTAGPAFVRHIAEMAAKDPTGFHGRVSDAISHVRQDEELALLGLDRRHLNTLALVETCVGLAREAGILPSDSMPSRSMTHWVANALSGQTSSVRYEADLVLSVRTFVQDSLKRFGNIDSKYLPDGRLATRVPGFIDRDGRVLYVQRHVLDQHLQHLGVTAKALKKAGILNLRASERNRVLTATPTRLLRYGFERRVYAIDLGKVGLRIQWGGAIESNG